MAVSTVSTPKNPDVWVDSEIDLRHYVYLLVNWWRVIATFTVVAVALAILVVTMMRLILPPRYISVASVALVRTSTDVTLDERFRTIADALGENTSSLSARRNALLGLVTTGTVAQDVIDEVADVLDSSEQVPANLMKMVSAEYASGKSNDSSDLINIVVTADAPKKAADIANAWAKNYIKEVNRIYGQVPNQVIESINTELETKRQSYLAAQAQLTNFTASNRIDELNALVSILKQQINQKVSLQQAMLLQWQQTQEQLTTAHALRRQIETGGDGAVRSTMAAVQILKISVYGMPSAQLQVEVRDIPQVTLEELLADVDGLVTSLEARLQDLNTQIAATTKELQSSDPQTNPLQTTLAALRSNQAQLEEEQSRQTQLIQQRDINWQAFQALSGKASELSLASAAASSEVRLGASAVPPLESTKRINLLVSVIIAAGIGLSLGIFYALFCDFMKNPSFLPKLSTKLEAG